MTRILKRLVLVVMTIIGMDNVTAGVISSDVVEQSINSIVAENAQCDVDLVTRGVKQVAALWQQEDGSTQEFETFVKENYEGDSIKRLELYNKLAKVYEVLLGTSNQVAVELSLPTILAGPEPTNLDYIMSAFNPYSQLWNDLYGNKVAFITILNFPNYTLSEKNALGASWSRKEWAYARMGDMFTSRVPAKITQ